MIQKIKTLKESPAHSEMDRGKPSDGNENGD